MRRRVALVLAAAGVVALPAAASAQGASAHRAAALVARMTPAERVGLVASGAAGVPRLGIPPLSNADGPNGVGEGARNVTAFPNVVNVGAAWDRRLARRFGVALGQETRATGHTLLFAPTLNLLRTPLWGRAAETYSEDPFLNSALVVPEIRGLQSVRVMAQAKHYAANNQEIGRIGRPLARPGLDVRASERTLHEMYFAAFKAAVRRGGAASAMCSYNRINGVQSCQDPQTLGLIHSWLRGFVGPDAALAVRSAAAAANAGVDNFALASPAALESVVADGQVSRARVAQAARRIVRGIIRVGLLGHAPTTRATATTAAHRALATRLSAEATVLLKNRRSVLPLTRRVHSIAVIGHDAGRGTQIEEGGSPAVLPGGKVITPLAGIRKRAPAGTTITYGPGTRGVVSLPVVPSSVLTPASGSGHGLSASFYAGALLPIAGAPVGSRLDPSIDSDTVLPTGASSGRWTGTLTPPKTGLYRFSLTVAGNATLSIAGRPVATGNAEWISLAGSPGAPDQTFQGVARLKRGQPVPIRVDYAADASTQGTRLHLGWSPPEHSLQAKAVRAARKADVAVVFANDVTGEGMDRPSLGLPGDQDQLITAVAQANPRTVVVLHTASAVTMPWRRKVAAIVEAWYPGQRSGAAIARTLWGDIDPSGRLPVTFPARGSQGPTAGRPRRYPGIDNVADYSEGLLVGYRWYDREGQRPLFPFGFGKSYTRFRLGALTVRKREGNRFAVRVPVRNVGARTGAEVVQLYVGDPRGSGEPPHQLKGFDKLTLRPGRRGVARMHLGPSSFATWSTSRHRSVVAQGRYRLFVGTSSRNLPRRATVRVRR